MQFDLPKDEQSIIKVIGVGGGGSNAVNHMFKQGIKGVDFVVCNTDAQALQASQVPVKIQLGATLTEGRGAGSIPEIGRNAAVENIDDITDILCHDTKMVFITAGMGGGTGTGAAPVIASKAREMGILTVGIVTVPFAFEGRKRRIQAEEGLEAMRNSVDTLLVINNDRLREMYGNLSLGAAFSEADNVLATAAKGIAELISVTGNINVDFNDVRTVMHNSGVAIMGCASAEGEDRALRAVEESLSSPLLNDNDIQGAQHVLLNIAYGEKEVLMDEISQITDYIQDRAGSTADVIWGHAMDTDLGDKLCVTLIATGFKQSPVTGFEKAPERRVLPMEKEREITRPITTPTQGNSFQEPQKEEDKEEELVFRSMEQEETPQATETPQEEPQAAPQPEAHTLEEDNEEETTVNEVEEHNAAEQGSFNWDVTSQTADDTQEQRIVHVLDDEGADEEQDTPSDQSADMEPRMVLSPEEQQKRSQERLKKIQEYTSRIKSGSGLSDMEQEPAYQRNNVKLFDAPHSSDEPSTGYTLDSNGDGPAKLRPNSFLHDNVD